MRTRTAQRSAGVCIHQVMEDGRWVDRELSIGGLRIPIIGVANCTGGPLPEARVSAERLAEFPAVDRRAFESDRWPLTSDRRARRSAASAPLCLPSPEAPR